MSKFKAQDSELSLFSVSLVFSQTQPEDYHLDTAPTPQQLDNDHNLSMQGPTLSVTVGY